MDEHLGLDSGPLPATLHHTAHAKGDSTNMESICQNSHEKSNHEPAWIETQGMIKLDSRGNIR
jgi:hypothetical protein